jgi:hypothetical protein
MSFNLDRRSVLAATSAAFASASSSPTDLACTRPASSVPDSAGRLVVSGAIGDGRLHPLSERFTNLAEAQRVFPAALSLDESLDGAAIQSAINLAEQRSSPMQRGASVFVPAGRYPLSRPLSLPNNVALEGEGRNNSIIDNQNSPLATPLIVNRNKDTARLTLRDMSLHGGTHGIRIEVGGSVDGVLVEGVSFQLQQDSNFSCNKLLQMATFRDCTFGQSPFGVYAAAWTSNVVAFDRCSFENHSRAHLYVRGAECINITGGRFEGGVMVGQELATIDLESAAAVNFIGVYFENTHQTLLRERKSRNGVSFTGCHFTGTQVGKALAAYRFDSDGIVTFGTNDWILPTEAPAKVALNGVNEKLITDGRIYVVRTATDHHIRSERVALADLAGRDLLTVHPQGATSAELSLMGSLEVEVHRGTLSPLIHTYDVAGHATGKAVALRLTAHGQAAPPLAVRADPTGRATVSLDPRALATRGRDQELRWTFRGRVAGETKQASLLIDLD